MPNNNREDFKNYCLRRLGAPVIDINVDNEQIEDRIDDAIKYYQDYHFDGSNKVFFKHKITATDIANKYIPLSNDWIGVNRILNLSTTYGSKGLFDIRYQMHLNDFFNTSSHNLSSYVTTMSHISLLEEILNSAKPIRFNRHINKLFIDMDWTNDVNEGEFIVVEGYQGTDPETYSDVWNDMWLQRYTTALIKRQWGQNLSKFEGMQLPGGVTFNGAKLYDEAVEEINKLEEEMIDSFSLPAVDIFG